MCFFKHLEVIPESIQALEKVQIQSSSNDISNSNDQNQQQERKNLVSTFGYNQPVIDFSYSISLLSLISMIKANTKRIQNIQQKINQEVSGIEIQLPEVTQNIQKKITKDDILCKLFGDFSLSYGDNLFKYKLSLDGCLPNKFYKHRKYSLGIKLMPLAIRTSKIIFNSNLLNICIGVFDKDGNWVNENILGQPILQGLTQVDLYQGKASFPRLLFNQISSNLPKQKLNLAIYVKPGLDAIGNGNSSGNFINWKSIKPLILKNVVVLSKKRKNISQDLL